jgi:uncharacterized protein
MEKQSVILIVKPTHACNLNCPYCYEKDNRCNIKDLMTLDDVRKTAQLFKDSLREWIWHGGEPLLRGVEFFSEADKIIREIIPDATINMQTNGTLIDEGCVELFKRDNIRPGLSFDGINNNITRKSTNALMNSFKLLDEAGILFGSILLINPDNVDDLPAEYEFCKRLGLSIQMNTVFGVQNNPGAITVENRRMVEGLCNFFDYWMLDKYKPANSQLCTHYIESLLEVGTKRFCSQIHCVGKWFSIHADGKVFPCGRDWPDDYYFGNIRDINSVDEIYNSEAFKKYKERVDNLNNKCKDSECVFFYACGAGCYGTSCNHDNTLSEVDPAHCAVTKEVFRHVYNRIKNIRSDIDYNPYFIKALGNYYKLIKG